MTLKKILLDSIAPSTVQVYSNSIIVVPDWQDKDLFHHVHDYVNTDERYKLIHREEFEFPSKGKVLSKNSPSSGATTQELVSAYGSNVIPKVHMISHEHDATLAFIFSNRGFGRLGASSHYYQKNY